MKFKIYAEKNPGDQAVFFYDNETNTLSTETGFVYEDTRLLAENPARPASIPFDKNTPLKKFKRVQTLKIQLGLSCNYGCTYCSQRFVPRADETSKKYVESFLKKIDENLEFDEKLGLRIEFWGGEPLVYVKTLKPLVEALNERFASWEKKPYYLMITNGSLFTDEICDWLYDNHFNIAMSHDGPGQHVRGPDPFDNPELKDVILRFYKRMRPEGRFSFNAMLNAQNWSRKKIHDYFIELTGDPGVPLGEGEFVDAYDEGGIEMSFKTKNEHFDFRKTAVTDVLWNRGYIGFGGIIQKIDGFIRDILSRQSANSVGQKCGMDDEQTIAVDLRGNVVTCQNVSAVSRAPNGELHYGGNIAGGVENIALKSATHWRNRPDCANCPVLHLCRGACMFLDGDYWQRSCDHAFSTNIAYFALAIEKITGGYIPSFIEAGHLPPERQDIWGIALQHPDQEMFKVDDAVIIKAETKVIDGVEVFTNARVEGVDGQH